jgi:tRNA G26 N,N-dimethylase Trm1
VRLILAVAAVQREEIVNLEYVLLVKLRMVLGLIAPELIQYVQVMAAVLIPSRRHYLALAVAVAVRAKVAVNAAVQEQNVAVVHFINVMVAVGFLRVKVVVV